MKIQLANMKICEFTILVLVISIMHIFYVALQLCTVDCISNLLELENELGTPPGRTPALDNVLSYYQMVKPAFFIQQLTA